MFLMMKIIFTRPVLLYTFAALIIFIIYLPSLDLHFIGGDDFREIARAKFIDSQNPEKIFTTPHDGNRYRPMDRGLNFIWYSIWETSPFPYRARNLLLHIFNSCLAGYLISNIVKDKSRFAGPIVTLLFGLNPYNNLPVVLAVTTKTFLGLIFLLLSWVWLKILQSQHIGIREAISCVILSSIVIFAHEQLLLLIFFMPIMIAISFWLKPGKSISPVIFWTAFIWASTTLLFILGRHYAGLSASSPDFQTLPSIFKNIGFSLMGLFSPIDFLFIFNAHDISRATILDQLISPRVIFFLALWAASTGSIIFLFTRRVSKQVLQESFPAILLLSGLILSLIPVILFSNYSELYNYIPSMFLLALLTESIFKVKQMDLRKARIIILVIIFVFGLATLRRNLMLGEASATSNKFSILMPQIVYSPQKGENIIFFNKSDLVDGYSLYGLKGVGVFEEFGIEPFTQLTYGRSDLRASWIKSRSELTNQCLIQPDAIYVYWTEEEKTIYRTNCDEISRMETK